MKKNDPNIKLTNFLEEEKVFLDDLKKVDTEKNWKRFLQSAFTNNQSLELHFRT